jgi:cholesterol transport system auxiliary component
MSGVTGKAPGALRGGARARQVLLAIAVAALAGCAAIVDKPVQRTLYDFGPGDEVAEVAQFSQPPLVLSDVETTGALDGSAVLYRLGYSNANELRPYSQARWSAPPAQLVRQRLREHLGRERVVLSRDESASLAREGSAMPRVLRVELEEFSHFFDSPGQSHGLLRLRVTLLENTPAGEKLLAQRRFGVRQPASTTDAPGGVRALAAATDAAAKEIGQWLRQLRTAAP